MRNIANPARQLPTIQARSSNQPISFETTSLSNWGRRVEKEAIKVLANFPWPGNVRQLRHVVEKLVATTLDGDLISADLARQALPNGHLAAASAQVPLLYHENDSLEAFLDRTLLSLYEQLLAKSGSHSQAARLLRIDRTSLYQRLERARRRVQGNA